MLPLHFLLSFYYRWNFFLFRCSCIVLFTGSYNSFPFTTRISFLTSPRHFLYYQKSFSLPLLFFFYRPRFLSTFFTLIFRWKFLSQLSLHHRSFIILESPFDLITFLFCFIPNLFSFYCPFVSSFLSSFHFLSIKFLLSTVARTRL